MKAIIFDLDGVIVSTDHLHYISWKRIADKLGIFFDEEMNSKMRGISRRESLEVLLTNFQDNLTEEEKHILMEEKNTYYKKLLESLSPSDILKGIHTILDLCNQKGIKKAIGSSSKNAPFILKKIGLFDQFDVIIDGNHIVHSKPNPEVFLKAAERLILDPKDCIVIEDAHAGLLAAKRATMKAYAVGEAVSSTIKDGVIEDVIRHLSLL